MLHGVHVSIVIQLARSAIRNRCRISISPFIVRLCTLHKYTHSVVRRKGRLTSTVRCARCDNRRRGSTSRPDCSRPKSTMPKLRNASVSSHTHYFERRSSAPVDWHSDSFLTIFCRSAAVSTSLLPLSSGSVMEKRKCGSHCVRKRRPSNLRARRGAQGAKSSRSSVASAGEYK